MITEWAGYTGLTDRHAKKASYTPAGCRETVIRVPHDRPIKVGDIVQHEVSPQKKDPRDGAGDHVNRPDGAAGLGKDFL